MKRAGKKDKQGGPPSVRSIDEGARGDELPWVLVDAIPQIVWTASPDGAPEYFNTRWLEYTGLPPGCLLPWHHVIHPDQAETCVARFRDAVRDGTTYQGECQLRRRDGAYLWHLARAVPVRDRVGRIVKWLGTCTDIEDRKCAEESFLAELGHELRTPLAPALFAIDALRHASLPPEGASLVAAVRRNIELESRLIDDLLDRARIQHGKLELRLESVDMHALIASVLEICRGDIEGKRLRVTLDLRAARRRVRGDPARLSQVLWNLIKNAAKFTPEGGSLRVSTSCDGARVGVSITDSGIGIDGAQLRAIFEPFAQGERTITRRFGGLGLGLTISRSIVKMHGGDIVVASDGHGRGATFTVRLPLAAESGERPIEAPPCSAPPSSAGARLLLVDDHEDTIEITALSLQRSGYSIATASSVEAAWALASRQRFDLVISDIGLPDGSGIELARRLREAGKGPAIAVSGYGSREDVQRSLDAGFAAHLVKPLTAQALLQAIDRVLATKGPASAA